MLTSEDGGFQLIEFGARCIKLFAQVGKLASMAEAHCLQIGARFGQSVAIAFDILL